MRAPPEGWSGELVDLLRRLRHEAAARDGRMPSMRVIAGASGYSVGYVNNVFNGIRTPAADAVEAMASALGASAAEVRRARFYAEQAQAAAQRRSTSRPVPHRLPPDPGAFAGREHELDLLTEATFPRGTRDGSRVVIVTGIGGVGKTWLVVRWGRRHATRFPDGQVYVDLGGFTSADEPMPSEQACRTLLAAFGVRVGDREDPEVLYRDLVSTRRVLIVLDNARDAAQVAPLLSGEGAATVVVTSRDDLSEIVLRRGAGVLRLDPMSPAEARAVLVARLGDERLRADERSARIVVDACGGLPLALGIVGARAALHADWPLSALAAELADSGTVLDALSTGTLEGNLRSVFASSDRPLRAAPAALLRLLSLVPGPEVGLAAAASIAGRPLRTTRELLRDLERVGLVRQPAPDLYALHDLVRLYWAERAAHDMPSTRRETAVHRMTLSLLYGAYHAERRLAALRAPIVLVPRDNGVLADDPPDPLTWFDREYRNLIAAQQHAADRARHRIVWQLAWCLDNYHYRRGMLTQHSEVWQRGLASAQADGDTPAVALAELCYGNVCTRAGRYVEASGHLARAMDLATRLGDTASLAQVHRAMSMAAEGRGDTEAAIEHATAALRLFEDLGEPLWSAVARNALGEELARSGDLAGAREHCTASLAIHRAHQNRSGEAATLDSLGIIARAANEPAAAAAFFEEALSIYRELGNDYSTADTLARLGDVLADTPGRTAEAERCRRDAYDLYRAQHRTVEASRLAPDLG
ncbi:tetratricopeptide repeat protein [Actinoplanes sp. CA-030573]|uniref:tetratricopeptide repeat protein n=1 Tax=Actinoplanes sp. CA-030573 TaxID=3239898 RepID=UPI003D8D391C